jgi:hypothetical protein
VCKTFNMDSLAQLREIQCNGAVAQVKQAGELLIRITSNPGDTKLRQEASELFDAYLNDPYLTKNQE